MLIVRGVAATPLPSETLYAIRYLDSKGLVGTVAICHIHLVLLMFYSATITAEACIAGFSTCEMLPSAHSS